MSAFVTAGAITATLIGFGALLISMRHRAYRRRLSYDPTQSLVLGMAGPEIETVWVRCDDAGFALPEAVSGAVSGFLELKVRASAAGKISDPTVVIRAEGFTDIQHLERGALGTRFFNISRLLSVKSGGDRVHLNGRGVGWEVGRVRLHICREKVMAGDRVLVVAPHPDDAEIAAFGLYTDASATVVTLTAGDASDRYQNPTQPWLILPRSAVAKMRVWDSLTIPQFGGVPPERAINLCLPDGRLREMYLSADRDFQGEGDDALDFAALRRMNRSPFLQADAACTWKSLVRDLSRIIENIRPTIVVAPHPTLDPHPDHLFTTVALGEALQSAEARTGRMFLYLVHNRRSELWPFGPAGSGVALLPILPEDGNCASGFYSHKLSVERQRQKFIALEAMHDVRDMQSPADPSWRQVGNRVAAELRGSTSGIGILPTSYLRRSVRPDELFFITSLDDGAALARRMTEQEELSHVRA